MTKSYTVFDSHPATAETTVTLPDGSTTTATVPAWAMQFVPVDGVGSTINWKTVGASEGFEAGTTVTVTVEPAK